MEVILHARECATPDGDQVRRPEAITRRFGHVVRRRRVAAGMSQETFAAAARLHPTYISLLERGLRNPSLTSIQKLARALDTRMAELVAEVE